MSMDWHPDSNKSITRKNRDTYLFSSEKLLFQEVDPEKCYNEKMYYRYRRNADDNIRDLERAYHAGDHTVLEALVRAYLRAGSLSVSFLVEHPEIFAFLPEEWQRSLGQHTPPPTPFDEDEDLLVSEDLLASDALYAQDEEDDEEEEEDPHAAERDEGAFWECANCSDELFADDENEEWAILSEAAAVITTHKIARGDGGQAVCESCLNEAGLDLEEAVQNELPDYCNECGENEDDCECEEEENWWPEINKLHRETVIRLLEGIGVACYDDESTQLLREALHESVGGDIDPSQLTNE